MDKVKIRILLQFLPLILPLNIYMIGDWLGTGLQWAFLRYQQTYLGNSFIPLTRDIWYVLSGTMAGISGLSVSVWCTGAIMLLIALLLVIWTAFWEKGHYHAIPPTFTVLAGILFIISCMLQYGVSLYGPGGFSIPIGIPVLLIIGYWTYRLNEGDARSPA
ncbi:MAG: hypothetical protein A4E35_00917 [Methanoregula sp. PtaU1.Bin051]|nr:MAG: hypothetical protein A4E35_00917 [Methanoregula sp. PtaU1.Bin051]